VDVSALVAQGTAECRAVLSWQNDASYTGLVERSLILVYWSWLVVLAVHLP
jgi:hypothetical protein